MIRNAIYAASSFARSLPDTSADAGQSVAITLRWSDAASIAGDAISRPRGEARRETRAVSLAFITAGIAYIAMSMAVIQCCNAAASLLVGYINSLPALIVTSVFARGGWSVALAVATSWAALLLLMLSNDLGPHEALKITLYTMLTVAPQAIAVGLLLPRTTRVLLVGFAPVFGVMGLLALALMIVSTLTGWTTEQTPALPAVAAAVFGMVTGCGTAIVAIRRDRQLAVGALLASLAAGGAIGATTRESFVLAAVGSAGVNGLLALVGWQAIAGFIRLKQRGFLPDEVLHFMTCLLVPTIFPPTGGDVSIWLWLPYLGSAVILGTILVHRRDCATRGAPKRMLLLRVFGPMRIHNLLLDALDDSWRRVGVVDLVVGLDVALRTVSALSLENFLLGRAHRQFLADEANARQRLEVTKRQRRALDGRFPLNEWYCLQEIWPYVVDSLASTADVVLMDLRGFGEANRGVMFELSLLLRRVPLERVVFLTDSRTDKRVLSEVIHHVGMRLPTGSPNATMADLRIDLLHCEATRPADFDAVMNAVFTAAWSDRARAA
jgi:hypothetical protein